MSTSTLCISVSRILDTPTLEQAFAIRRVVFVLEQNCPPELEWEHEDVSVHFIAKVDGKSVGTCRWRKTEKGYKLERFAILKEYRGQGVGLALVNAALDDLPEDATYVYLHAQITATGLYEKAGFHKEGEIFEEASIKHYKMVLK